MISCKKNLVTLCPEKTKLQVYLNDNGSRPSVEDRHNPLVINGKQISFSSEAEHVGILRSVVGNGPTIMSRFTAHRKALEAVLHTGMALNHRGNPASSLRIEKLYATPVLLSGISALVLADKEIESIEIHYCQTLTRLLRLHDRTPRSVVYFLAGSLPGIALVHLLHVWIIRNDLQTS